MNHESLLLGIRPCADRQTTTQELIHGRSKPTTHIPGQTSELTRNVIIYSQCCSHGCILMHPDIDVKMHHSCVRHTDTFKFAATLRICAAPKSYSSAFWRCSIITVMSGSNFANPFRKAW